MAFRFARATIRPAMTEHESHEDSGKGLVSFPRGISDDPVSNWLQAERGIDAETPAVPRSGPAGAGSVATQSGLVHPSGCDIESPA
jgi:hypothetical protein